MFRNVARTARLAVLGVAFIGLGCESPSEPAIQPVEVEAPNHLFGGLLGKLGLGSTLEMVERTSSLLVEQVVTLLVDEDGGVIQLLGHSLTIPAGAVDDPTYFVMIALPGNKVRVELYAIDPLTGLDIGHDGFDVPVELTLSWADMSGVTDPDDLVIAYLPLSGAPQALPTTIDETAETARADLGHFSRYALCRN